ncbi:succinylglutamate desuccinylase/aspartoacylase family protein [Desulfoluna spongiiphila]|uniref:succinylglutamate desuccinylase/aspartoacylase family protein n=1 Tax=Desulfoluna spongiiphila TaxID=419481 RepID=UPI0012587F80|nr:succinylglutamate desuccinylase/aspartoacylase family protein [Desulfoluna spongiiphila]VVS91345.1 succinylglutamate desuccinylase/aspartoacylase [Desulfoluna spongiiphila]
MKTHWLIFLVLLLTCPAMATETITDKGEAEPPAAPPAAHDTKQIKETFESQTAKPFKLIGETVMPGTMKTLKWFSVQAPGGVTVGTPVIVINGTKPGPVLALTAAIHGDELNGIEIIRQVVHDIDPKKLKGVVVGVPIVNLEGFWRRDRYIGDRRDLNRYFPGNPKGSYPSRVAHALFTDIINPCDMLIDIHTGSFFRENLPQLRADLSVDQVADIAKSFGELTALQNTAPEGSLRSAATASGIPAVVMEIGGPLSLEPDKVTTGVKSIRTFLKNVGMVEKLKLLPTPQPVFYGSEWVRAEAGGILMNKVKLGASVKKGDLLAEIIDPVTNDVHQTLSPLNGTILGRAQNQFVSPGFAIFRVGIRHTPEELKEQNRKKTTGATE